MNYQKGVWKSCFCTLFIEFFGLYYGWILKQVLFCVMAEMGFERKEYEFLSEIGLSSSNLGCFVNGTWKGGGPMISTVNPANNQVLILWMCLFMLCDLLLIPVTVIMIDGTIPLKKIMHLMVFFYFWSTFKLNKEKKPTLRP